MCITNGGIRRATASFQVLSGFREVLAALAHPRDSSIAFELINTELCLTCTSWELGRGLNSPTFGTRDCRYGSSLVVCDQWGGCSLGQKCLTYCTICMIISVCRNFTLLRHYGRKGTSDGVLFGSVLNCHI